MRNLFIILTRVLRLSVAIDCQYNIEHNNILGITEQMTLVNFMFQVFSRLDSKGLPNWDDKKTDVQHYEETI